MISLLAVYFYRQMTYWIFSCVPAHLMILSTVYSGVALPCLASSDLAVSNSHCADQGLVL